MIWTSNSVNSVYSVRLCGLCGKIFYHTAQTIVVLLCMSFTARAQQSDSVQTKGPVYFIDSVRTSLSVLQVLNPNQIAFLTVLKGENALKAAGESGRNGAIYVVTKPTARLKYQNFFYSKSTEYKNLFRHEKESNIAYILNGEVLTENYESDLFTVDNKNFIELKVIDKKQLSKDFGIKDKNAGVVIKTTQKKKKEED